MTTNLVEYRKGDLFDNLNAVRQDGYFPFICHVVNNLHVMGAGFVVPLIEKYPIVEEEYFLKQELELGDVQYIKTDEVIVCNMIAQNGLRGKNNPCPLIYLALAKCMENVAAECVTLSLEFHPKMPVIVAPKFGSNLSGGDWNRVEKMIKELWINKGLKVIIYEL